MTGTDESDHPGDRFDSARRTVLRHLAGTCFECRDGGCAQHRWAVAELRQHPAGRDLLRSHGLRTPSDDSTQEGQQR
ncbi:hypothetical protein [Micromonospora sp. NPDC092111]|uniref:hypothetical protein n=1 Tax=Micromonospora sp. NPDC092111 TaxID=3364289 RepID=UPI003830C91D